MPHVASAWIPKGGHANAYEVFKKTIETSTDSSVKTTLTIVKVVLTNNLQAFKIFKHYYRVRLRTIQSRFFNHWLKENEIR